MDQLKGNRREVQKAETRALILESASIANPDIWLCYNCGDCSQLCPRDARPGDVLSALKKISIREYSKPTAMHGLLNDRRKLPWLFIIPAVIIMTMGLLTGLMNLSPGGDHIVFAYFSPVLLIEMIFIPLSMGVALVFFFRIKHFLGDMQDTYARLGKVDPGPIEFKRFLTTMVAQLPGIVKHERYATCSEPKNTVNGPLISVNGNDWNSDFIEIFCQFPGNILRHHLAHST